MNSEYIADGTGSSVLFITSPRHMVESYQYTPVFFVPTKHLLDILEVERANCSNQQVLELFLQLSSHSITRAAAGWQHEKQMHTCLIDCALGSLTICQGPRKQEMPPWGNLLPGTLASLRAVNARESFYWIPAAMNLPGIDAILGDNLGNMYVLRATTAEENQNPADGLLEVCSHLTANVTQTRVWHVVVVADRPRLAESIASKFSAQLSERELPVTATVWGCSLDE